MPEFPIILNLLASSTKFNKFEFDFLYKCVPVFTFWYNGVYSFCGRYIFSTHLYNFLSQQSNILSPYHCVSPSPNWTVIDFASVILFQTTSTVTLLQTTSAVVDSACQTIVGAATVLLIGQIFMCGFDTALCWHNCFFFAETVQCFLWVTAIIRTEEHHIHEAQLMHIQEQAWCCWFAAWKCIYYGFTSLLLFYVGQALPASISPQAGFHAPTNWQCQKLIVLPMMTLKIRFYFLLPADRFDP